MRVLVLKIVLGLVAAGCLTTTVSAQQGPEPSGTEAYELPEVIVDTQKQAAAKKKPNSQPSAGASEPTSGQSSASGEPEPIAADAAGAAPGGTPSANFSWRGRFCR